MKRKIAKEGIVNLTATCSSVIQQKLQAKMKDPGSFTIPCSIGKFEFKKALCDSSASINLMPLSVVQRLSLRELAPTAITLQMADRSMAQPEGVLEDVLVKVGKFIFLVDFCYYEDRGRHLSSSTARKTLLSNWSCLDRCVER